MFEKGQWVDVIGYRDEPRFNSGEIVNVRDILSSPLQPSSYRKHMLRSQFLVTVKLDNGEHRAFYDRFVKIS